MKKSIFKKNINKDRKVLETFQEPSRFQESWVIPNPIYTVSPIPIYTYGEI